MSLDSKAGLSANATGSGSALRGRSGGGVAERHSVMLRHFGNHTVTFIILIVVILVTVFIATAGEERDVMSLMSGEHKQYRLRLGHLLGRQRKTIVEGRLRELHNTTDSDAVMPSIKKLIRDTIKDTIQDEIKKIVDTTKSSESTNEEAADNDEELPVNEGTSESVEKNENPVNVEYNESMRSLGKLKTFEGGDLEDKEVLAKLVQERNFNSEIIIMMVNEGGEKSAINAILNLHKVGIDHYILLVQNEQHCRKLREGPLHVSCAWTSFLKHELRFAKWGVVPVPCSECPTPFDLWWGRLKYMGEMVEHGLNVLYMDTDVYILSDPYKHLHSQALQKHNVIIQRESMSIHDLNIGFIYLNNCSKDGPCRWIFKEALNRLEKLLAVDDVESVWQESDDLHITSGPHKHTPAGIWGIKATLWDQHIMNDVIETAVVNKVSQRRSLMRGIKNEEFDQWIAHLDLGNPAWLEDEGVYYQKLYNNVDANNAGTMSTETIAGAPAELLGGWDGIFGPPKVLGVSGWWHTVPPAVVHFVGASNDKGPPTKMNHLWRAEAECDRSAILQSNCKYLQKKYISFSGNVLSNLVTTIESYADFSNAYNEIIYRLLLIASVSGRTPVLPLVPCSIGQNLWSFEDSVEPNPRSPSWLSVNQKLMFMWPCGEHTLRRYSNETFQDDAFDRSVNTELPSSFGQRVTTKDSLPGETKSTEASGSYCCTPWLSRAIERVDIDVRRIFVGGCASSVVYEFEFDVIQEGYDIMNEGGTDRKTMTTSSIALSKDDVKKTSIQKKIGAELDPQLLVIENSKSLFWDEFKDLSDRDQVLKMLRDDCRVGREKID